MTTLVVGLILFLGIHSARIFSDDARSRFIAKHGALKWKGIYTVLSIAGFVAILQGFATARATPVVLWAPLPGMNYLASVLTLVAFILLVATYVPGNSIKARVHHPMILSVKVWALAHLLANNTLADLLLFGSFLVWSVLSFRAARARDRAAATVYPAGRLPATAITVVVGAAAWAVFALWVHAAWLGVRPLA